MESKWRLVLKKAIFMDSIRSPCGVHAELWSPCGVCGVHENSMGQGKVHIITPKTFLSPSISGMPVCHVCAVFR